MRLGKWSRFAVLGVLLAFAAVIFAGCGGGDGKSAEKKFLNIATGGTAGTYYPIGGAMAEILNKKIPGMNKRSEYRSFRC